jgi:hypothetical protein
MIFVIVFLQLEIHQLYELDQKTNKKKKQSIRKISKSFLFLQDHHIA